VNGGSMFACRRRTEMHPAIALRCGEKVRRVPAPRSTDQEIRDFLSGKTDGEDLLHAIFDHVLDEPIPERLRAVLKR
jgi:hypothetical protein